jgi:hypothetical protein
MSAGLLADPFGCQVQLVAEVLAVRSQKPTQPFPECHLKILLVPHLKMPSAASSIVDSTTEPRLWICPRSSRNQIRVRQTGH